MNMRMNLTGLADAANAQLANKGRPLALALDDILPDPDNPRNADDDVSAAAVEAQNELDADVAARGVKTPISVRPHPTLRGKYIINYGHRRYKSARTNKLATIPAFIDETFDSYDQVNENELRVGLTTRARALFIKGRLDAGDSKGEIAERMRKRNQTFITEHLALIDAPSCVNEAYAAGVTSARTLYDLLQAWREFPTAVDAWCRRVPHISREAIREALAGFRHDEAGEAVDGSHNRMARIKDFSHDDEKALPAAPVVLPTSVAGDNLDETPELAEVGTSAKGSQDTGNAGKPRDADQDDPATALTTPSSSRARIAVSFQGKLAWISPDVVVSIVLDGDDEVLNVRLGELLFKP